MSAVTKQRTVFLYLLARSAVLLAERSLGSLLLEYLDYFMHETYTESKKQAPLLIMVYGNS